MPGRSGRGALRQGLDKDVYQVVTKYIEQEPEDKPLPSATDVWQWIQRSNSSLKRKPKKLLLDSIERVIEAIVEEASDEEVEPVGDFTQDAPSFSNIMNKSIVGSWAPSGTATPLANGDQAHVDENVPISKKRQANGEPVKKKRKATVQEDRSPPMHYSLKDLGGVGN
ncbi:hypothetical protein LTS18_002367, partial [Coniosporium uncinatum]